MIDKIRSLKNGEEVDWGDIHTVGFLTIIVGEIDYGFDYRGMQELTAKLAIVYKANNDSGGFVLDSNDVKSAVIVAITLDIYAHLTPNVMEEAAKKIESRLFGK